MDTGTVRLVIFVGMFLVFAGDYNSLMSTIFGTNADKNGTTSSIKRNLQGKNQIDNQRGTTSHNRRNKNIVHSTEQTLVSEEEHPIRHNTNDDDDEKNFIQENAIAAKAKLLSTIKSACLPKLICELTASTNQDQLTDTERSLLNLIRDTSLSTTAEVASRYHFAAHMGQLISGLEGQGCHNFYPTCPFPGSSVLSMMKKVRLR